MVLSGICLYRSSAVVQMVCVGAGRKPCSLTCKRSVVTRESRERNISETGVF